MENSGESFRFPVILRCKNFEGFSSGKSAGKKLPFSGVFQSRMRRNFAQGKSHATFSQGKISPFLVGKTLTSRRTV
jgi:hypothetical protein